MSIQKHLKHKQKHLKQLSSKKINLKNINKSTPSNFHLDNMPKKLLSRQYT